MWETPTRYAIMKGTNKRATKVCDTKDQAEQFIKDHKDGKKMKIEIRPGERKRCEDYCDVQIFCKQYEREIKDDSERDKD
jgi:hypothetical protein